MKITIGSETLNIYDNIKEMPISVKQEFEKCLWLASGIGASFQDFEVYYHKIDLFLAKNRISEAREQLRNQRQLFLMAINNIDPTVLAFVHLVSDWKIENEDQALEKHQYLLKLGITPNQVESLVTYVKKNYIHN